MCERCENIKNKLYDIWLKPKYYDNGQSAAKF